MELNGICNESSTYGWCCQGKDTSAWAAGFEAAGEGPTARSRTANDGYPMCSCNSRDSDLQQKAGCSAGEGSGAAHGGFGAFESDASFFGNTWSMGAEEEGSLTRWKSVDGSFADSLGDDAEAEEAAGEEYVSILIPKLTKGLGLTLERRERGL